MAAALLEGWFPKGQRVNVEVEGNFATIAFAVSTLVVLLLRPLSLVLGIAAAWAMCDYKWIDVKLEKGQKPVDVVNATLAIVGATACLVGVTPGGNGGSLFFNSIPLLASFVIGHTLYCWAKRPQ